MRSRSPANATFFLKDQNRGAAAGAKQTLWKAAPEKHSGLDIPGIIVLFFAVALGDIADHQSYYFNHRDHAHGRAPGYLGVEDRYHPFVL